MAHPDLGAGSIILSGMGELMLEELLLQELTEQSGHFSAFSGSRRWCARFYILGERDTELWVP